MNWISKNWPWLLGILPGWLALVLAVLNLYRVRVSREVRATVSPDGNMVAVAFVNKQGPEVLLREIGFEYGDGTEEDIHHILPPAEVLPGRSRLWPYYFDDLRQEVAPVNVYFRDEIGQKYRTRLSQEIRSRLVSGVYTPPLSELNEAR